MKRFAHSLLAVLVLAAWPLMLQAQSYPSKPISFIVPSPPGGGTDTLSRVVAGKLSETLQWLMVLENRPGAGGNIGMDLTAKAPADGYTIALGESANLAINPSLYVKMPYDAAKDLAPVVLIGTTPLVLVVSPARSFDSLAAVVAAAKTKSLAFASSGNGTVGHLAAEIWKRTAGIELLHVPYKGAGPAIADVMGGQVDLHFASSPAAAPLIRSGKLRALAVTSTRRAGLLPEVPTIAELGYGDFDAKVFYGIVAPAGTPAAIVGRLNAEINRALQAPDIQASLVKFGVEAGGGTPAQFAAFLDAERVRYARAVKDSGAKVDRPVPRDL